MIKEKYEKIYNESYINLNEQQKRAVDRIEGPVLVNAGPGTGKTQILAVRIGKILLEQDVSPHNILCLTYTDAATIAMRNRLVEIVGPEAHKIHIYTFHGFCNQVIQENLDYFGGYKSLEPISDLERVDIYRNILDGLDDEHPLKRFKSDRYYEVSRLRNLFDMMKKEDMDTVPMHEALTLALEQAKLEERFYAKRKYTHPKTGITFQKGDFRFDNYEKYVKEFDLLKSAIDLFPELDKQLNKIGRYDYQDMILWVIRAFKDDSDLLAQYQERYLYFLVDEFQDTNGAQNHLLDLLIQFWDQPNVFVVGDDDQAIYKFQGANLNNIIDFTKKYDPYTVVLEENYRSNQDILDHARILIENNEERLVNHSKDLTKSLNAKGPYADTNNKPKILAFQKISEELTYIAQSIENLYLNEPSILPEIAIIYRNHRQVENLVQVFEKRNIPLNIKRKVNVLELPLITGLINILRFVADEHKTYGRGQHRLFKILHYKFWGNQPLDVGRIAMYCQQPDKEGKYPDWRAVIQNENILNQLELNDSSKILDTAQTLESLIQEAGNITLQSLFENLINQSGLLRTIMQGPDKAWDIQVLNTFFNFIKDESARMPELNLNELLDMVDKMNENGIELPINKIISSDMGVNFITAHSAKGLEFKMVYMLGCTKDIWDKSSGGRHKFKLPTGFNADGENTAEDERRLFYVAMTRAKTNLFITYSERKEDDKELGASMFVDEVLSHPEAEKEKTAVAQDNVIEFYYSLMLKEEKQIPLVEKSLIDNWLKSYKMSVTHLNKYLKCPLSFYFESVLRVPHARNASSGFGNAVHHGLWAYFNAVLNGQPKAITTLQSYFEEGMSKYKSHFTDEEFESYTIHGKKVMHAIHEEKAEQWFGVSKMALEEKIDHAEYQGVPLKGFLDKVEIYDHHVHVVDYKTGKFKYSTAKLKPPSDRDSNGGDYWRQLVFYKILLDSDKKHNWHMDKGAIEYIEPDTKTGEFKYHEAVITQDQIDTVGQQIVETFENIKAYQFDKTCAEDDCAWCNFVQDNYTLDSNLIDEEYGHSD
ncbi:MAG: ATP-dependent helicase [Saprospiraceae bacterium]|nr:ATP-dependent helicase [Saprospiraceae bacterium]